MSMNKNTEEAFRLKAYGRTELALIYSPDLTPKGALARLNSWIRLYPGLEEQLTATGFKWSQRSFTPAQVGLIIEALGEP